MDLRPATVGARWLAVALPAVAPVAASLAGEADFEAFLAEFRHALAVDDRATVTALTRLPFLYEGRYLAAAEFRSVIPGLFPPAVRRCLAKAPPLAEEDRYVVFCTPYGFYFGRVDDRFLLIEFMADGEG